MPKSTKVALRFLRPLAIKGVFSGQGAKIYQQYILDRRTIVYTIII